MSSGSSSSVTIGIPFTKLSVITPNMSGLRIPQSLYSSFVIEIKSLPKKTLETPWIPKSFLAIGEMCVYRMLLKSIVFPSFITGFPGKNFLQ